MSPRICSCTLCGSVIADVPGNVSWLNQFRGLSSSPTGIILTGVGLYDDPGRGAFIAPVDPDGRWDDPTYESPEEDQFGAMSQGEVNRRHGFVFHEACWDLLEKAFHPRKVPLSRLFDICRSLPFPINGVSISWGHDYGGPVLVDHEHRFPWEDRFADREYLEPDSVLYMNPFEVPEVQHMLTEVPESPPSSTLSVSTIVTPGRDRLDTLPGEIRSVIAMYLPTLDVLNLRLASRVFWTVFDSQQFWASRFRDVSDRSWLFEARDSAQPRDWRWLYRRTNDARIGPGLRNRVRIWNLAQKVVETLSFHWVDIGLASPPKPESSRWVHVAGDLWEQLAGAAYALFDRGCRLFHKHRIAIFDDLSRLSIACVQVGDTKYISGLKITTAAGNTRRVGYWSTTEQSVETSEIRGFKVAVGSRGVQALQCIPGASDMQHWIGSPEGSLKTQRLGMGGRVTELEVGFDSGCVPPVVIAQTSGP
ncbi:F-box domain-containing protein [Colletotrichum higginsianum]|uniref:F-box domain-containing protein n=1 Tax=Colletotrichum higginsianum (strain IMI 349063) TaxID=759273 RepID=H1V1T6_COLHI|nr:F-box domain-containing protein [Colletotrichum higginsianum]